MTKGEYLITKKDECIRRARETNDPCVRQFLRNAAEGFLRRMENMTVAELEEPCIGKLA